MRQFSMRYHTNTTIVFRPKNIKKIIIIRPPCEKGNIAEIIEKENKQQIIVKTLCVFLNPLVVESLE